MEDLDSFASNTVETRIRLDRHAVDVAVRAGVLDIDEHRTRTRHYDGRLLGADSFRRDHTAFDRRQRDTATLLARGVVAGLEVRQAMLLDELGVATDQPDPTRFTIEPGHGVTRSGDTIVVGERIEVDLTQLPLFQQLDATFALDRRPREPSRTLGGVFVMVLRSIRYTANPVAPYPTEITGERQLQDGDVIEASVVTLVPIDAESSLDGVDAGPAVLARRVFAEGLDPLPVDDALPIAILALARGQIAWLDVDIARTEALAEPARAFSAAQRSVLDAHLRHFATRMQAILARRAADGLGTRFAATDYFEVLPPSGSLPPAAVSVAGDRLLQWFFPSTVEADLALIPEDELPALIEEAMSLGALTLTQGAKATEAAPVMILIPVPRATFLASASTLGGVTRQPIGPRLGSYAYHKPVEAWLHRVRRLPEAPGPTVPELVAWESALASATSLYFVRERRRARTSFALPRHGPMPEEQRPSGTLSQIVVDRITAAGEIERFDRMLATAGAEALERLEALFSLPVFGSDPLFVNGVIAELSSRKRRRLLEAGTVTAGGTPVSIAGVPAGAPAPLRVRPLHFEEVDAVARRYEGDAALGPGMAALRAFESQLSTLANRLVIAQSLRLPELDRRVRSSPSDTHQVLAATVLALSVDDDVNGLRDLVGYVRAEPPPLAIPRFSNGTLSTGFPIANADGQGGLFSLLWNEADDGARSLLDGLFAGLRARQPLASAILMTGLCRLAWRIDLSGPDDARILIESLYRWPFTPATPFRVPTLSFDPAVKLSTTNPLVEGFLKALPKAEVNLAVAVTAQTTLQLEAAGFPGHGLKPVDAYRILGCAFDDLFMINLTALVRSQLPAQFPTYVAALSDAVAAFDLQRLTALGAEWEGKL